MIIEWIEKIGWFNFICGLATLASTFFTFIKAREAKKAATEAEKAKNAVLTKKRDLDFAAFITKANEVERILSGWMNSSKGRNFKNDYEHLQAFISDLNKIIPQLADKKGMIERQYNKIDEKILKFNQPVNGLLDSNSKDAVTDMLYSVRSIIRGLQTIITE